MSSVQFIEGFEAFFQVSLPDTPCTIQVEEKSEMINVSNLLDTECGENRSNVWDTFIESDIVRQATHACNSNNEVMEFYREADENNLRFPVGLWLNRCLAVCLATNIGFSAVTVLNNLLQAWDQRIPDTQQLVDTISLTQSTVSGSWSRQRGQLIAKVAVYEEFVQNVQNNVFPTLQRLRNELVESRRSNIQIQAEADRKDADNERLAADLRACSRRLATSQEENEVTHYEIIRLCPPEEQKCNYQHISGLAKTRADKKRKLRRNFRHLSSVITVRVINHLDFVRKIRKHLQINNQWVAYSGNSGLRTRFGLNGITEHELINIVTAEKNAITSVRGRQLPQ